MDIKVNANVNNGDVKIISHKKRDIPDVRDVENFHSLLSEVAEGNQKKVDKERNRSGKKDSDVFERTPFGMTFERTQTIDKAPKNTQNLAETQVPVLEFPSPEENSSLGEGNLEYLDPGLVADPELIRLNIEDELPKIDKLPENENLIDEPIPEAKLTQPEENTLTEESNLAYLDPKPVENIVPNSAIDSELVQDLDIDLDRIRLNVDDGNPEVDELPDIELDIDQNGSIDKLTAENRSSRVNNSSQAKESPSGEVKNALVERSSVPASDNGMKVIEPQRKENDQVTVATSDVKETEIKQTLDNDQGLDLLSQDAPKGIVAEQVLQNIGQISDSKVAVAAEKITTVATEIVERIMVSEAVLSAKQEVVISFKEQILPGTQLALSRNGNEIVLNFFVTDSSSLEFLQAGQDALRSFLLNRLDRDTNVNIKLENRPLADERSQEGQEKQKRQQQQEHSR